MRKEFLTGMVAGFFLFNKQGQKVATTALNEGGKMLENAYDNLKNDLKAAMPETFKLIEAQEEVSEDEDKEPEE